jgi:peptide/nickel transport system permease protein
VLKLVGRRVLTAIPILLGIMLLALLLVELMPGDPATFVVGEDATPEALAIARHDLRLDEPLWKRFVEYVWDVAHGDLGESPGNHVAVWDRVSAALPVTLSLAIVGLVFSVVLGVPAGTLAALRRDRFADRAVTAVASGMQAVPPFVVGLALVVVFAVDRSWFPAAGYIEFGEDPWEWFRHLVLPGLTLAMIPAAQLTRQTRGALVDILEQDYIRAARAKGLRERAVIGKHAAKNAATPVVTVLGLQVGAVLGGAVVVELIFGLSGFGGLALSAALGRDLVLIQGVVLISAIAVLITNLLVDVSYGYFNPRLRV